jgi:hypothetical protein
LKMTSLTDDDGMDLKAIAELHLIP